MNNEEANYQSLLQNIISNGSKRSDRTGVGTIGLFGTNLKFSLEENRVPMLTTKKMFSKGIIEELLFFLRGETNTKVLEDKNVNIWKGNTTREFLDKRGLTNLPEGHMGKGYGFQWRNFGGDYNYEPPDNLSANFKSTLKQVKDSYDQLSRYRKPEGIDQLSQVIHTLKTNPTDRRIIMTAWNPQQLPEMALPPCHMMVQFYVDNGKLSSQFYMRSVDTFLGLPFNLLSYAILTRIVAQTVGMEAKELIFVGGDTHIYNNHVEQVMTQINREPYPFPTMTIDKKLSTVEDIESLQLSDFIFKEYQCHPSIIASMAI